MDISRHIEHTNLSPTLSIRDIDQLVEDANRFNFPHICVPPFWVKRAKREISTSPILLITVAGFPFGYNMTETKLDEIKRGIDNGADEIDVVWNVTSFKTGIPWTKIEIAKCAHLAHNNQKILKVILETSCLSDEEIKLAAKLCADAGSDFIKTSTGFSSSGPTEGQIRIIRNALPPSVGVVASGIGNLEQALKMVEAGADRIGTDSAFAMISTLQPTYP